MRGETSKKTELPHVFIHLTPRYSSVTISTLNKPRCVSKRFPYL